MTDAVVAACGALVGGLGSLWFAVRAVPPHIDGSRSTVSGLSDKKLALLLILAVYCLLATLGCAVALVLGAIDFAVVAALLLVLAGGGLLFVWFDYPNQ
jgi:hypothetical protein